MDGKIRIKHKETEIEIEGPEDFINFHLSNILNDSSNIIPIANYLDYPIDDNYDYEELPESSDDEDKISNIESFCDKIDVNSTEDLILSTAYFNLIYRDHDRIPKYDFSKSLRNSGPYYDEHKKEIANVMNELEKNGLLIMKNDEITGVSDSVKTSIEEKLFKSL
jgi:hypothetical protein